MQQGILTLLLVGSIETSWFEKHRNTDPPPVFKGLGSNRNQILGFIAHSVQGLWDDFIHHLPRWKPDNTFIDLSPHVVTYAPHDATGYANGNYTTNTAVVLVEKLLGVKWFGHKEMVWPQGKPILLMNTKTLIIDLDGSCFCSESPRGVSHDLDLTAPLVREWVMNFQMNMTTIDELLLDQKTTGLCWGWGGKMSWSVRFLCKVSKRWLESLELGGLGIRAPWKRNYNISLRFISLASFSCGSNSLLETGDAWHTVVCRFLQSNTEVRRNR